MELASNEAIKHCVAAGLGISAISAHALDVDPALDHLCVLDVEGFPVRSQWYLASPAQRRLSVVAQAFKDFLLAEAPRLRAQHAAVLQRHLQRHGT
jgi:DNA-binding transcriptional LysR family regulator